MRVKKYDNVVSKKIREVISSRYKRITKAINREFWNSESETNNSIFVGSYGRNTAISTSDIDILVMLPEKEFDKYNNLNGNGQSRLLQAVRNAIKVVYPNSDIRADGQIVKVNFSDGIQFEVLPAFIFILILIWEGIGYLPIQKLNKMPFVKKITQVMDCL